MKIIAKTDGGFILQATESEILNIAGFDWRGSQGAPTLGIGVEINVSGMFSRIEKLNRAETELKQARQSLRSIADLLEPIEVTKLTTQC
jgi:hypothetical protein